MAEKGYLLSNADREVLRKVVAEVVGATRNAPDRSRYDLDETPAPEFYICRTPKDGIPARSTESPSLDDDAIYSAECQVYRHSGADLGILEPVDGLLLNVFNLSDTIIDGETWIVVQRDKFGKWYTLRPPTFPSERVMAQLSTKEYTANCIVYSAFRVVDGDVCSYNEPDPIPGGNCLTVYHEQGTDLVVYPPPSPRKGVPTSAESDSTMETGTGTSSSVGDAVWETPTGDLVQGQSPGSITLPAGVESEYLKLLDFCLNVPESVEGTACTVSSIEVRVTVAASGAGVRDKEVKLVFNDLITGNSRHTSTEVATSYTQYTFSGTVAEWSATTNPSDYNTLLFGCAVRYENTSSETRTLRVSSVEIRVFFTPAGQITKWCVVHLWPSENNDWWLTDHDPRVEFVEEDGNPDVTIGGVNYTPAFYMIYSQDTKVLVQKDDALIRTLT